MTNQEDEIPLTATNDSRLRFAREQGFFDQNMFIRFLIGFVYAISIFIVLHFREAPVEILEKDSIASQYVVAQVPFDFVDDEATLILKQEAVRDIGRIYKVNEKQVTQRRTEFEKYLDQNDQLKQQLTEDGIDEVFTLLDIFQKGFSRTYLTDPRTMQKLQETELSTDNYQIYTPLDINYEVTFPQQIWVHIQKTYLPKETYQPAYSNIILEFFKSKSWKLEDDVATQRKLRKKVQAEVPDKYTHVSSGSRIIDQGEKVTARHVAMLQAMKDEMNKLRNLWHPSTLFGTLLLTMLLTGISAVFLYMNYPLLLTSNRKLCLLVSIIVLTLLASKAIEYFVLTSRGNLYEFVRYPLLVPFAAILACNLMNVSLAIAVSAYLTIILSVSLAFNIEGFMLINLVGSVIAIISTRSLRRRKELFVVCGKVWASCLVVVVALHLYNGTFTSIAVFADAISSGVFMTLTAISILAILPFLESTFKVMSDVTLMEYMDPNNELLRRLSFEAPGTYQHTLIVCTLAETAAMAIGANGLFCRVATLYHDIGKMTTPQYFTENQLGDVDMHKLLTPTESAQAIIAHVTEGVSMARKVGLPEQFIDIIKEHHGTQLVYYFYRKQLDQVNGDASQVNEEDFRYAGPKPKSKESAIIMIADTFEAASRSLDNMEEQGLTNLVDKLVREKAEDGQLDECLLTFQELKIVKKTLVKTLAAAHHSRIKYPERPRKPVTE